MKKILYFFTIFLTLCTAGMHNAYASSDDDTRKITVSWKLNTDPAEYSTSISNYTVTTFNESCKSEPDANNPQKHYFRESEQTFTCKKDIQSLALNFSFYNRPTGVKNFTETLEIKNNKDKYKIEKTLQYLENTTERDTRLTQCKQKIPTLFEKYCDDEGYRTGTQVGDGPSWGKFKIADGIISIGCYTYKKRKDADDLIAALKKECNLSDNETMTLTPTRPNNHIPENAITVKDIYAPGSITISGTVKLRDSYLDESTDHATPCPNCKILIESTQEEIGTTDENGNFSGIYLRNKNKYLEFKYNDDYETYTTHPEHIKGPIYLKLLTISGYIRTQKGPGNGISDATITNLRTKKNTNTHNDSGHFSDLPAHPTDKIKISAKGYKTQTVNASVFNLSDTNVIIMEPENGAQQKSSKSEAKSNTQKDPQADNKTNKQTTEIAKGADKPNSTTTDTEKGADKSNQTTTDTEKKPGGECTTKDKYEKKARYKKINDKIICVITKCNDGYMPSDDGQKCEVSEGPCNATQLATVENAIKGELKKGKCHATECKPGYEVEKHKCVEIAGNCPDKPENAKKSHRKFDSATQAEVCIIDECKDGYKVSDDGKSCIEIEKTKLSREDSQKRIDELQENADAMKEKEQSTANKLLGGAAIGATGIGAMQAASAYSEQAADEDAETAMRAYLATFHCNYGGGKNVPGGEKNVELPGGNELIDLYAEYVNLANNLKVRKAALDMRPGIESEAILDSATSGLYDDVAIGKTSGAFTSLARALMDPDGEDAAAWAAQKDASAQKMKTGLTTAGIGVVGGAVGNLLINKDSETEKSKEINEKYEKLKKQVEEIQQNIDNLPQPTCDNFKSQGVNGGTFPNCTCKNSYERFFAEQGCVQCPTGQEYNAQNQCVPIGCKLSGDIVPGKCECAENATKTENKCKCDNGYTYTDGQCNKIEKTATTPLPQNKPIALSIPTDTTFESGKAELKQDVKQKISNALNKAIKELGDDKQSAAAAIKYFRIEITGHTDRVLFKKGSNMTNKKLSEKRAKAIKKLFVDAGVKADTITTSGKADTECTRNKYKKDDDPKCRRVDIKITLNSAGTDLGNMLQKINIGDLAKQLTSGTKNN